MQNQMAMHHDSKITFTPCLPYFHHQTHPITPQRGLLHHIQIPPKLWHPHIRFFKGYWATFYNKIIKWSRLLVPICFPPLQWILGIFQIHHQIVKTTFTYIIKAQSTYQSTLNLFEPQTFELFFKLFQHIN